MLLQPVYFNAFLHGNFLQCSLKRFAKPEKIMKLVNLIGICQLNYIVAGLKLDSIKFKITLTLNQKIDIYILNLQKYAYISNKITLKMQKLYFI